MMPALEVQPDPLRVDPITGVRPHSKPMAHLSPVGLKAGSTPPTEHEANAFARAQHLRRTSTTLASTLPTIYGITVTLTQLQLRSASGAIADGRTTDSNV